MIHFTKWLIPPTAAALLLGACSNQDHLAGNDPLGTGPFDRQGRYREDWADDPTKWRRPGSRQAPADDLPAIAAHERPPAHSSPLPSSRPAPTTTAATPRPAPPKPAPKPQPVRYTVKSGDSLYAIARRHNTTVAALQRANGISGSLIHPGQRLVIPR